MAWVYIILTSIIYVVSAQTEDSTAVSITLPPDLQKLYNEAGIDNTKDKYMEMFKKKCEKNGHPEAFDKFQVNILFFISCAGSLVDIDTIQEEIEDAKPTGKVDEVFKKYCNKSPEFKTCFYNLTESVKPCFSVEEQKNFKTLYNVTDQLVEFVCYKDGDRIALFIAEGGVECFKSKSDDIMNCFNQTFDVQTQNQLQNITIDDFFNLEFKEKQCNQLTSLQGCVVNVLEKCTKPTSANIVESLFNFIRKSTPCKNMSVKKSTAPGAASGLAVTSGTLLMALAAAILV